MAFTRRYLPHIDHPESTYFITYRQKGTWKSDDTELHAGDLCRHEVAEIILNSWQDIAFGVELHAICIMCTHVHIVLTTLTGEPLSAILASHKKFTARRINSLLGRQGPFWAEEAFDRLIREGKFEAAIQYTMLNPVKAGVVSNWKEWPFARMPEKYAWAMQDI